MSDSRLRILFVINKKSGKKRGTDWEKEVKDRLETERVEPEFLFLPVKNADTVLHNIIKSFKPVRVVAAGGDGTVGFVGAELLNSNIELAILPAGSANGMATELNIPANPAEAIDLSLYGRARATDVIRINDQYLCLHLSDVGINAQIIKHFEEGPWRGMAGYGLALIKTLFRRRRIRVRIESREEEIQREALMVIIANASKYGTGAKINPVGDMHDGYFEVVVMRKLGIKELMKMFMKFQRYDPKKIEVISAKAVTIESKKPVHFQVDGEYLGRIKKLDAKILHGKLKVVGSEGFASPDS